MAKAAAATASPSDDVLRYKRRSAGANGYVILLGLDDADALTLSARVRKGLSFRAFERLQRNYAVPAEELAELVQISTRTLARRRSEGRFSLEESDRLVRASRILGRALDLFEGDADAARAWLSKKAPGLGGRTPLEVADTDIGAREVESLIGRLEHGVFA